MWILIQWRLNISYLKSSYLYVLSLLHETTWEGSPTFELHRGWMWKMNNIVCIYVCMYMYFKFLVSKFGKKSVALPLNWTFGRGKCIYYLFIFLNFVHAQRLMSLMLLKVILFNHKLMTPNCFELFDTLVGALHSVNIWKGSSVLVMNDAELLCFF